MIILYNVSSHELSIYYNSVCSNFKRRERNRKREWGRWGNREDSDSDKNGEMIERKDEEMKTEETVNVKRRMWKSGKHGKE